MEAVVAALEDDWRFGVDFDGIIVWEAREASAGSRGLGAGCGPLVQNL